MKDLNEKEMRLLANIVGDACGIARETKADEGSEEMNKCYEIIDLFAKIVKITNEMYPVEGDDESDKLLKQIAKDASVKIKAKLEVNSYKTVAELKEMSIKEIAIYVADLELEDPVAKVNELVYIEWCQNELAEAIEGKEDEFEAAFCTL